MASIALIHGSTQNATCWDLVRPHLESRGHTTVAIELPADRPDLTATELAKLASESIAEDSVVVAHSASGILLPLIAQLRRVQAVVYLAALIPSSGMSVLEMAERDPDMLDPEWVSAGPRWADPANWRELADQFLFHDVVLADREWAYTTLRPMRLDAAFRERLTFEHDPNLRMLSAHALLDRTIHPKWQERTWRLTGAPMGPILGGHCPHISTPLETAGAIGFAADAERWQRMVERQPGACAVPSERRRIFMSATPETRAEMMRTQVRGWMDRHRDSLSADQIALLEEHIAFLTADLYQLDRPPELIERRDALMARTYTLFRREELRDITEL